MGMIHARYFALAMILGLSCCSPPAPAQAASGEALLQAVRTIADAGRLDDAAYIGSILNLRFQEETTLSNVGCREIRDVSVAFRSEFYRAPSDGWFRRTPDGVKIEYMVGPSMFSPHTKVEKRTLGEPVIDYRVGRELTCGGAPGDPKTTMASLSFDNIPGFACIDEAEIRKTFGTLRIGKTTDVKPPEQYVGRAAEVDFWLGGGDFQVSGGGPYIRQPVCLISLDIR